MSDLTDFAKLTGPQMVAAAGLFLPGFVSLKIDRLVHPGEASKGAELLVEALGYSLINAALLSFAIEPALRELGRAGHSDLRLWGYGVLLYVAGPALWPLLFRMLQRAGARRGWLLSPGRSAWDNFFLRRQPCWVVVHFKDGPPVAGYFGAASYASLDPRSGEIYLEELWVLDAQGDFSHAVEGSKGALFRSGDYVWIELFKDRE